MKLPKLAIENHQFTNVIIVLLVVFGFTSFFSMPRYEDPRVNIAASRIFVIYPGASPTDLEEMVIDPIEEVINELEDIKKFNSIAGDGYAAIFVEFTVGSDPDDKYSEVLQQVNSIRNNLPDEIISLEIDKMSMDRIQILQIALSSDVASYILLEREMDKLSKIIEKSYGVKRVQTWAYPEQEIRIAIDLEKLAQAQLPLNRVIGAIQSANQNIPGGNIDMGSKQLSIKTSGSYQSIEDIKNTIIHSAEGKILYLKDVADVHFDYEDNSYYARFKNKKSVFITVSQKEGTNIFTVIDAIKERIDGFKEKLPESIELSIVFDQAESVANRLNGFSLNLTQGLILVGFVVLLAVGIKQSIIVILAIPISLLIGIGFIDKSGFGLQQMTITGMVIALGLLVDNAIVVIENITRFMKMGYSRKEAAVKGTSQVGWAVVSSTATTVLAFVPMLLMNNMVFEFIRSLPVTVIYTLSASLLISLTLTPYLSNKFIKIDANFKERRFRTFLNRIIETRYRKTLNYALSNPAKIILAAVLILVMSLALFPVVGISFFPKAEKPQLIINIDTPNGASLDKTEEVTLEVEKELQKLDEIKHFATNIGHGNPRIYYNVIPKSNLSTHAQIFAQLKEYDRESFDRVIDHLREEFSSYVGAKIEVKEFEQGPPVEAPIAIRLMGKNLNTLKSISEDVEKMIKSTEGTVNIVNPLGTSKTDLHIKIDRIKAGILGIPLVDIDRTIRASVAGLTISKYRDPEGKEYNIVVRLPMKEKTQLIDLERIYVSSVSGSQIPLVQVANIEFIASPMKINHYHMERNVTITADVVKDVSVNEATNKIIEKLDQYNWPKEYRYVIGGAVESQDESFGGMLQAVIIALIGIFGVLVLQFRSYTQPLIVFSAFPLAIIGSMIMLLITGNSFSFTAFIGLASLVGIVINNSIILVDYTNQLRREGKELVNALKEACETRFIPIILTTATTVGGLLPLTLSGGTLWEPMGWTIIGGLIASTFLTLIIVPVLYKMYTINGRNVLE